MGACDAEVKRTDAESTARLVAICGSKGFACGDGDHRRRNCVPAEVRSQAPLQIAEREAACQVVVVVAAAAAAAFPDGTSSSCVALDVKNLELFHPPIFH